ncbi:hypothetical protein POX_f07701 [Penicillium oxalicum]|uniref:hypothetical protein n=1 Tax=Penicillium oxalicum TaxID=69781 RepID=UPI0020B78000|nr:hypothetical protein POX_f07701 [Penicillium oxalicum]KAI2787338.1 hypothetical protein POX_f07701 [Penicillium oxalicum]
MARCAVLPFPLDFIFGCIDPPWRLACQLTRYAPNGQLNSSAWACVGALLLSNGRATVPGWWSAQRETTGSDSLVPKEDGPTKLGQLVVIHTLHGSPSSPELISLRAHHGSIGDVMRFRSMSATGTQIMLGGLNFVG